MGALPLRYHRIRGKKAVRSTQHTTQIEDMTYSMTGTHPSSSAFTFVTFCVCLSSFVAHGATDPRDNYVEPIGAIQEQLETSGDDLLELQGRLWDIEEHTESCSSHEGGEPRSESHLLTEVIRLKEQNERLITELPSTHTSLWIWEKIMKSATTLEANRATTNTFMGKLAKHKRQIDRARAQIVDL